MILCARVARRQRAACIVAWFLVFTERATAFVIDSAVTTELTRCSSRSASTGAASAACN